MRTFVLFLVLVGFTISCSDFDKFYEEKKANEIKESSESTNAPSESSEIIAKVGSENITKDELVNSLRSLPPKQRVLYASSPEQLNEYVESYVDQILLTQEAERLGIDKRDEVKQSLEAYKQRLLIQAIGKEIEGREVKEEDMQRFYDENSDKFQQIRLSIIFVRVDPQNPAAKDTALKKAESITKKARGGYKFDYLVQKYSDDEMSKPQKGDTGYIQKGRLPLEIESKIFNLKEGEISDPIEAPNGYYVAKVTEGPQAIAFEQAKETIDVELKKKMFIDYIKSLREKTKVEVFQDNLKEINLNDNPN